MDPSHIKDLVVHIENSLPRGSIYHINYSVTNKRTAAYYLHLHQLIDLLQKSYPELLSGPPPPPLPGVEPTQNQTRYDLVKSFKHQLLDPPEYNNISDYSLDGIGFYMKQELFILNHQGNRVKIRTIYASDGKIMGIFYLDDAQAVIQPATERPQVPTEDWTQAAYSIIGNTLSHFVDPDG